ncbi:unnamed protein product [Parnassius apollo]|uniref:(apollo) hypothetical protein n=1 Tax=Parnassius apollo TaxID=110799 RepID=A0A8S3Y1R9_PARAO|nr:unnamed protein product [Parnassius apollo]
MHSFLLQYPAPAIGVTPNEDNDENLSTDGLASDSANISSTASKEEKEGQRQLCMQPLPGTLPETANQLSNAARALLMRLLERDPKVRMRSLRQLQQSALYMGFNFEHVKARKVSPKSILERHFPQNSEMDEAICEADKQNFVAFDQAAVIEN